MAVSIETFELAQLVEERNAELKDQVLLIKELELREKARQKRATEEIKDARKELYRLQTLLQQAGKARTEVVNLVPRGLRDAVDAAGRDVRVLGQQVLRRRSALEQEEADLGRLREAKAEKETIEEAGRKVVSAEAALLEAEELLGEARHKEDKARREVGAALDQVFRGGPPGPADAPEPVAPPKLPPPAPPAPPSAKAPAPPAPPPPPAPAKGTDAARSGGA